MKSTIFALALCTLAGAAASTFAFGPEGHDKANPPATAATAPKGVQPGDVAPAFSLTDTDGKTVDLDSLLKDKKALVIEWYNPGCPFIVKHHEKFPTFSNLYKNYADKGVAFVAINSSAPGKEGHGLELNQKSKADWKIEYPILLDETGATGKAYGAVTTPHMFVITPDKKVVYAGAIDSDRSPSKAGDINYVAKALDSVLKGESVETASTRPYGCGVKYGK